MIRRVIMTQITVSDCNRQNMCPVVDVQQLITTSKCLVLGSSVISSAFGMQVLLIVNILESVLQN